MTGDNTADAVFTEGGATWMEDQVYDSANDSYNYLWPDFTQPMGSYTASPYPYFIAFQGLTERFGAAGEQVMQDFWEETSKGTGDNLSALQTAMSNQGVALTDAFHDYAITVKFNKPCTGGYAGLHCFGEGPEYVAAAGATTVHATLARAASYSGSVADNLALRWVRLPAGGASYSVTLANLSTGGQLRGSVVCDTGSTLLIGPLPTIASAGVTSTLNDFDPAGCASVVAVITNQAVTAAHPSSSAARGFSVTISA